MSRNEARPLSVSIAVPSAVSPLGARLADADLATVRARLESELKDRARSEGRAQALHEAAGALEAATVRLDEARESAADELTRACVTLAVEIAREIVQQEFEAGRYDVERIVRESLAVSGVARGESVVVHVHPEDAAALASTPFRAGTSVVPDPEVARGDVHVTTPHGTLVRDMEHALASIRERLRSEVA